MKLNKIRILHIIPDLGSGGAEMLVKNLVLSYDKEQFEVAVCCLFPKSGTIIEQELEESRVKVFYLKKRLGPDLKIMIGIYKVFRNYKPDVIHTHRYVIRYTLLPFLFCRIQVKIHTIHNIAEKEVDFPGKLIQKVSFRILGVQPIGISKEISRTAQELYRIKNIPYIYNGVPINLYRLPSVVRKETRASLNISDNQYVGIHIGRFSPQKNHKLLIEAFSMVTSKLSNVILLLVGDGELRPEIEELVKTKGLGNKVRFLGLKKNIPELLCASDLFTLSSDWEGVPLVVLEAMAAGKPVVATAVGGLPEMITNDVNGFLVKANNVNALAEVILKISQNPNLAKEMGKKSRMIVGEKFDIRTMTKQYENLYVDMLIKVSKKV